MTRDEWLKRCGTVYDLGLANRKLLVLMANWLDFVMRFEHTWFSHSQGQGPTCIGFLEGERERMGRANPRTLANDPEGYALQNIAAILSHPCQKCAEDREAWHTRPGFCQHDKNGDKDTSF